MGKIRSQLDLMYSSFHILYFAFRHKKKRLSFEVVFLSNPFSIVKICSKTLQEDLTEDPLGKEYRVNNFCK